jgi:hypothetical protein
VDSEQTQSGFETKCSAVIEHCVFKEGWFVRGTFLEGLGSVSRENADLKHVLLSLLLK